MQKLLIDVGSIAESSHGGRIVEKCTVQSLAVTYKKILLLGVNCFNDMQKYVTGTLSHDYDIEIMETAMLRYQLL